MSPFTEALIHRRLLLEQHAAIGSMFPVLDEESNKYLMTRSWFKTLSEMLLPSESDGSDKKAQGGQSSPHLNELAAEWVRLFGNKDNSSTGSDANEGEQQVQTETT